MSAASGKRRLWLFLAAADNPDAALAMPAVAWMAADAGALFEGYLEARRDGLLFGGWGSTVLGGGHHHAFNYLLAALDVSCVVLGDTALFGSSIETFGLPVLAQAATLPELYRVLLEQPGVGRPGAAVFAPLGPVEVGGRSLEVAPYLFPEVLFRRALAFGGADDSAGLLEELGVSQRLHLYLSPPERETVLAAHPGIRELDRVGESDTYGSLTLRLAERWKDRAKGVAFGDPTAILSRVPSLCREERVAVFGELRRLHPAEVAVAPYPEERSEIAAETAALALEIGNPVLVGRQTGDGDLFEWGGRGVALQIMDPNRPPFPVIETVSHRWAQPARGLYDAEPTDEELLGFAREGKILATLMWHSGEVAHNEAMLNLFDLAGSLGLKMGYGVHAARYETAPQLWELMGVPRERGGALGLVEPVLHSGGRGVMAEAGCPPERLREHCEAALGRIRALAGPAATPRGYYAFMDADLQTLTKVDPRLFEAIEASGLEYAVSSAWPGRNRIVYEGETLVAINQTARSVAHSSPFLRVTTIEELAETAPKLRPGWLIATLDAPVIAFNPYIWRDGSRFMRIADWLTGPSCVNVLPRTVARYARLLGREGFLPAPPSTKPTAR